MGLPPVGRQSHPAAASALRRTKQKIFPIIFARAISFLFFPLRKKNFLLCPSADAECAAASHSQPREAQQNRQIKIPGRDDTQTSLPFCPFAFRISPRFFSTENYNLYLTTLVPPNPTRAIQRNSLKILNPLQKSVGMS